MINEETLIAVTVIGVLALLVIAFVKYFMDRPFVQPDLETKTYTRNGVRYVEQAPKIWWVEPWEGIGLLRALFYGTSYIILLAIVSFLLKHTAGAVMLLITVALYLTLLCVVQNLLMLRKAKKLAALSRMPNVVYNEAYKDRATRRTRIFAFWIGWVFERAFKKQMQNLGPCQCEVCKSPCQHFDQFEYDDLQQKERSLKSVVYKPYICENGHVTVEKEIPFTQYEECPICQGITVKMTEKEIAIQPTYSSSGLGKEHYSCQYCGYRTLKTFEIPQLEKPETEVERRSYPTHTISSSSSKGSFGGGRSGGGGSSGRW